MYDFCHSIPPSPPQRGKKKKKDKIHFCYILIYSLFIAVNIPFIHRPSETLFPEMLDWKYGSNLWYKRDVVLPKMAALQFSEQDMGSTGKGSSNENLLT